MTQEMLCCPNSLLATYVDQCDTLKMVSETATPFLQACHAVGDTPGHAAWSAYVQAEADTAPAEESKRVATTFSMMLMATTRHRLFSLPIENWLSDTVINELSVCRATPIYGPQSRFLWAARTR